MIPSRAETDRDTTQAPHPEDNGDRAIEHGATALASTYLSAILAITGAPLTGALLAVPAAAHAIAWRRLRRQEPARL